MRERFKLLCLAARFPKDAVIISHLPLVFFITWMVIGELISPNVI
jgi:hypothetical protein